MLFWHVFLPIKFHVWNFWVRVHEPIPQIIVHINPSNCYVKVEAESWDKGEQYLPILEANTCKVGDDGKGAQTGRL